MRLAHLMTCAAFAALLTIAGAARAQGTLRIAVVPYAPLNGQVPERAGAKAAMLLAGELKNLGTVDPTEQPVEKNVEAEEALQTARNIVNEAEKLRDRRRFGAAAEAYRRALEQLDRAAPYIADVTEVSDIHIELAVVLYLTGDDANGAAELRNAISLTPTRTFAREATSPLFKATVAKVREQLLAEQRGTLEVASMPPGAKVLLDGQEVGRTPLTIRQVPPGKHLWRVLLSSSDPIGGMVTVPAGKSVTVAANLGGSTPVSKLNALLVHNKIEEPALALLKEIATEAQADLVAFGTLYHTEDDQVGNLTMESFLFSPAKNAVVRLKQKFYDAEMLSAGMAMYEVATEVNANLETFGTPEKLPARAQVDAIPASAMARSDTRYPLPSEDSETVEAGAERRRGPITGLGRPGESRIKLRDRDKDEQPAERERRVIK